MHASEELIAGIMIVSLHRPKVLTKTVRKFTAGFSNVQHVTSLAKDRIDHAGGSTIEPPIEVNTCARGSYRISLRREVTCATPGSVAWKCSWWCLVLVRAGGKGTMDQDVTQVSFSPMDAQRLVVKYVRSGWVSSQNAEIRQKDFLGWKLCTRGTFPDRWILCSRSLLRIALSRLISFARCHLLAIKLRG